MLLGLNNVYDNELMGYGMSEVLCLFLERCGVMFIGGRILGLLGFYWIVLVV